MSGWTRALVATFNPGWSRCTGRCILPSICDHHRHNFFLGAGEDKSEATLCLHEHFSFLQSSSICSQDCMPALNSSASSRVPATGQILHNFRHHPDVQRANHPGDGGVAGVALSRDGRCGHPGGNSLMVASRQRRANHFADLSLYYRGYGPLLQRHQSSSGAGRARDVRVDTRVGGHL